MTRKIPAFMLSLLPILFMSMLLGPLTFILLNRYFSWEFLRLGLWVSLIMLIGVLLNLFISRQLAGRIRILYLHGLSSLLSLGVAVSILVTVFVLKPFFLAFGAQILLSYTAILFLLICIVNLLVNSFSLYQKRAVEHEKSLYEERQMRGDMERKLHTSRVNPHFLFNSLNLMVSLLDDREKAEDILIQLADLLR